MMRYSIMLYQLVLTLLAELVKEGGLTRSEIVWICIWIFLVVIVVAGLAGSGGSSGGSGGSSRSASDYTRSFEATRRASQAKMHDASDKHLDNVRNTLRK